jgi:citrate lyase subunit beta/citryl-CoA lyase
MHYDKASSKRHSLLAIVSLPFLTDECLAMQSLLLVSDISDFNETSPARTGLGAGADILVIDLSDTDGEASASAFGVAYDFIRAASAEANRPRLFVRVPALDKAQAINVLDAAIGAGAEGIVLPGALGGHDVTRLDARISVEEAVHAVNHGRVKIIAEAAGTARAAMGLASFRGASHRLVGLIWSAERLAADFGGISSRTRDGTLRAPLDWTRGQFLVAARAAGVTAITDIAEMAADWRALCAADRDDSFGATLTRDPNRIAEIAGIMEGACPG